jgi:hypothetical protein
MWKAGPQEMELRFSERDERHIRVASLVHALDAWDQVALHGEPQTGPMRLVTREGQVLTGYDLFRHLVRSLRLLWPVAIVTWLPGAGRLGPRWFPGTVPRSEPAPAPGVTPGSVPSTPLRNGPTGPS